MISFTHSRLYKDIGSKAFFTMATLLMPLLENDCLIYSLNFSVAIFVYGGTLGDDGGYTKTGYALRDIKGAIKKLEKSDKIQNHIRTKLK